MKILFILHYPPPVHGSAIIGGHIRNSRLINNSFDCRFINFGTSVTVSEIGNRWLIKTFRYFSIICQIFWNIIVFRPELCYFTITSKKIGFYKDLPPVLLAKLFRRKIIFHFHNKGVSDRQEFFLDNLLYRFAFNRTDVILISKLLLFDVQKYFPENRVHYCLNGIPDFIKNTTLNDRESDVIKLLFVSNLTESKGVFILLDACALLKRRGIVFHCDIVGAACDISENQLMEKISEHNLEDFVSYRGFIYGTLKEIYFSQADIFVHPSYLDCLPLVILEAMQHSLPVVSTFEGAVPEAIEDGISGFLIKTKDFEALARKLEILISNIDLRIRMGEAGRKKYEKEFSITKFENKMVCILNSIGGS